MREKKKKEKIIYIDDGSTVADMSSLSNKAPKPREKDRPGLFEMWKTYWNAMKLMFLPTLAICGYLAVVFGIVAFIFWLM